MTVKPSFPKLMIVGAFPPQGSAIFGGVVTGCRLLLESSLPSRVSLQLIDSTQITNPPPSFSVRAYLAITRFAKFVRAFEANRPDAVLLFTSSGASALEKGLLAWYVRTRGSRAMLFPRGGRLIDAVAGSRATKFLVRSAFRGAAMVLCQGDAWQRFATEELGFESAMAPVIPNWTATPRLIQIGRDRPSRSDTAPVELLFVGWVERNKGVLELVEAFRVISEVTNARLTIVGDGHAMEEIRDFAFEHGLEDRIMFTGWLDNNSIAEAYAKADVLALPSWAEGLPNAMIEAMAARLAVVVSAVGNIPDVVNDGREALLVPPRNVDALVSALYRLCSDPTLRQSLADRGHELASKEFVVETAVTRLLDAVDQVRFQPKARKARDSITHN